MTTQEQENDDAVRMLLCGYREEVNLYEEIRRVCLEQREALAVRQDLAQVCDLLDEKDDILRLIGEIDVQMSDAKTVVLNLCSEDWPEREKLGEVLDRVTGVIEDVRRIEQETVKCLATPQPVAV